MNVEKQFTKALKNNFKGQLDHVFLCHNLYQQKNVYFSNIPEWDQLMNFNVRSKTQLISMSIPFLKMQKGTITVLSSNAGKHPMPISTLYSTNMAMLNMLVQCSALENAYWGVRCNAVCPGVTLTHDYAADNSLNLN